MAVIGKILSEDTPLSFTSHDESQRVPILLASVADCARVSNGDDECAVGLNQIFLRHDKFFS